MAVAEPDNIIKATDKTNNDFAENESESSLSKSGAMAMPKVLCRPQTLAIEPYLTQKRTFWPKDGQHILAQFDENTVVVYQAFNPAITEFAVRHQRFGGDHFSFERMSWIKTNFLWMMYRCGWAAKSNQERVVAVRIQRKGFEHILANAYTAALQKSEKLTKDDIAVRLQWDPDHCPAGDKLTRRAIQLGLKNEILRKYATEWIVHIEDITEFVKGQYQVFIKSGEDDLLTPSERVYPLMDHGVASRIQQDFFEDHHKHPVVVKPFTKEHTGPGRNTGNSETDVVQATDMGHTMS